MNNSHEKRSF